MRHSMNDIVGKVARERKRSRRASRKRHSPKAKKSSCALREVRLWRTHPDPSSRGAFRRRSQGGEREGTCGSAITQTDPRATLGENHQEQIAPAGPTVD